MRSTHPGGMPEHDTGGGMPEGTEGGIDTSAPEFKAAVEAAIQEQGVVKALKDERDSRKKLEGKLKEFDGIDAAEVRKVLEERQKAEEEVARKAGDFEKLRQQDAERFAAEVKKRDEALAALRTSLEQEKIDGAGIKAISKYEGDAELLLPHVRAQTKLIEVNGRYVAVVHDETGQPRLAPDAKTATDYMGVEHLVGSWKEAGKFAGAFAGTGASGGGASGGVRDGGSGTPKKITLTQAASMSSEDLRKGGFQVVDG